MKNNINENEEFLNRFLSSFQIQTDFIRKNRLPGMLAVGVPSNCYQGYRCLFCNRKEDEEEVIDLQILEGRLKENKRLNINMLVAAGSEPFNHPQIIDVLRVCSAYFPQISTFGLVEKLKDVSFVNKIKKAGITEVSLPLYSADKEVHNEIIGKDNFEATLLSIKNLKKKEIKIFIHSILLKKNLLTLKETEDYVRKEHGLPFIVIPFRPKKGLNEAELLLDYSGIIKYLKNKKISSLVGFPLCVQEKVQKKKVASSNVSSVMKLYILLQKFHKLRRCNICSKQNLCSGVFVPYCTSKPFNEIKPFA